MYSFECTACVRVLRAVRWAASRLKLQYDLHAVAWLQGDWEHAALWIFVLHLFMVFEHFDGAAAAHLQMCESHNPASASSLSGSAASPEHAECEPCPLPHTSMITRDPQAATSGHTGLQHVVIVGFHFTLEAPHPLLVRDRPARQGTGLCC